MTKYLPIETEHGTLKGRDAIFLDEYSSKDNGDLTLKGEISCSLASNKPKGKWCPYTLVFHRVLAVKITELDTFEFLQSQSGWIESSFCEVIDSNWKSSLIGSTSKVNDEHSVFIIQTYDLVFELVCESYSLEYGLPRG